MSKGFIKEAFKTKKKLNDVDDMGDLLEDMENDEERTSFDENGEIK